jgi:hypothetical protein
VEHAHAAGSVSSLLVGLALVNPLWRHCQSGRASYCPELNIARASPLANQPLGPTRAPAQRAPSEPAGEPVPATVSLSPWLAERWSSQFRVPASELLDKSPPASVILYDHTELHPPLDPSEDVVVINLYLLQLVP